MVVNKECMAETTDSENQRKKENYDEGVFDQAGPTFCPPTMSNCFEMQTKISAHGCRLISL
jgi:hypothetical protein